VLGIPFLGALQDHSLDHRLETQNPAIHAKVAEPAQSKYGMTYSPLDKTRIARLPANEQAVVEEVRVVNNQAVLAKVAILPGIMCLCYLSLIIYFRSKGGYRQVEIFSANAPPDVT
jgi:hypothetical protein